MRQLRIVDFEGLFDGLSDLSRERQRLFFTYARFGRGLEEVLAAWGPKHPELLAAAEAELKKQRPDLRPFELQLQSLAWHAWASAHVEDARAFVDGCMRDIWDRLSETQKSTFLAVTHALHKIALIGELERVTHIKGKGDGSGTNQFRIFGNLRDTALGRIRSVLDGPRSSIHPGYPEGFREREREKVRARLQICTREILQLDEFGRPHRSWEATDRGCDIDVDYRGVTESGHLRPTNSDVTSIEGKIDHFARHQEAFGPLAGLSFA